MTLTEKYRAARRLRDANGGWNRRFAEVAWECERQARREVNAAVGRWVVDVATGAVDPTDPAAAIAEWRAIALTAYNGR
jgi:hypothetical protein